MTEVVFHFGVASKQDYTCRLLRKAVASGARLVVLADAAQLEQLDHALWALSPVDFVAHCVAGAPAAVRSRSPVVLVTHTSHVPESRQILVNTTDTVPEGFEQFERMIEVVSSEESDRLLARQRWRHYATHAHPIRKHEVSKGNPTHADDTQTPG
ncbi:MAG: DNA polymerase III subunit chi [Rhodoferax sp.]|nr:DNA polymerase III subunit chi [Rhodoferax sp.]